MRTVRRIVFDAWPGAMLAGATSGWASNTNVLTTIMFIIACAIVAVVFTLRGNRLRHLETIAAEHRLLKLRITNRYYGKPTGYRERFEQAVAEREQAMKGE